MSLRKIIAGLLGIEDNSEIQYSKGYNNGYNDGYAKAKKEFEEQYEIIDNESNEDYENGLHELNPKEDKIFKKLKSWRYLKAQNTHIKPYMVLKDEYLIAAIKANPQNIDELKNVKGFGEKNIEKYGKEIIKIINKEN
jgi:ribonuclease D